MSGEVVGWAFKAGRTSDLEASRRYVLVAYADNANHNGKCWPDKPEIIEKTGLSQATVYRAISDLEAGGFLHFGEDEKGRYCAWLHVPWVSHGEKSDSHGENELSHGENRSNKEPSEEPSVEPRRDSGESPTKETAPLSYLLADMIESNGSKRPRVTSTWETEEERMLRIDERDPYEAAMLIRWCQADEFWRSNILSMGKFRAKYDQIRLRAGTRVAVKKAAPEEARGENIRAERAQRLREHDEAEAARREATG